MDKLILVIYMIEALGLVLLAFLNLDSKLNKFYLYDLFNYKY